jgi:hypothetical protein
MQNSSPCIINKQGGEIYIHIVLWMKEIQFAVAKAITVSNNFSISHVKEGKLEDLLLIFIH